ncbi:SusC/RagA family TonB-linked outer membrane protein [Terrimonas alba]|uniref:SusC/RagA family TonB-linked outer membrane protein n=1 Tax=Terrimonas alba TaxID=3349636 RepID=UPI0035F2A9F5
MKKVPLPKRRTAKRSVTFLIVISLLASERSFAFNQTKVNFGFRNTPVEQVIKKVEKLFNIHFTYDPRVIKSGIRIDLPKKERTLEETLQQLSKLTGLEFLQSGNLVGIQQPGNFQHNSNITRNQKEKVTIKGKVTDSNNQPIAGATVAVKGTNRGVTTDESGNFSIEVEKGETLEVSFVDFTSQQFVADRSTTLNIVLISANKALEEVVVTALGVRKEKAKVAYAIQEVKGEALQKAPETNVANNLVGKVAGLSVYTKSTLFENPEIYIRGQGALVVIDGVPTQTDFWNINPNDVESVNVLKGTAAAALYGSLGINGAIMITTKKGKSGANGTEVSYNTTTQFQAGFLRVPKTQKEYGMGWDGYYAFIDGKGGGSWYDDYGYVWGPKLNQPDPTTASGFMEVPQYNSPYDPNQLFEFKQNGYTDYSHYKPMPWVTKGQNNLKNFLQNELSTTHNISVAGKTDRSDYRISVSHTYQKGQVPNTKLNSSTLSLAGSLKVTEKLKTEASIAYNRQYTPNYPETGYGPNNFFYNILLWMGPDVDIRDLRNYWQPAGGRTSGSGAFIPYGVKDLQQFNYNYSWYNNPYYLAHEYLKGYTNDVIVGQVNATYDFTKDLQLLLRTGATTNQATSDVKTPYSFINYGTSAAPKGNYSISNNSNLLIVSDVLLTYKKTFLKDFSATVSVGGSNRYNQAKSNFARTNGGLTIPKVYNLKSSINPLSVGGDDPDVRNTLMERQIGSVFGYADIGYKNMVYLNFSGRNDWTSTLQKPHNSFFYPSVSLSVIGSEIVKLPTAISFFKLRGSYANISSDVDPYYTLQTYRSGTSWSGTPSLSLPGTIISADIRPRTTISQEYGTEFRFLKNRVGIDFTWFRYLEKNFPKDIPISQASGYNSIRLNADEIYRKGIEVVVSGTPIRTNNLKWDVILNYSNLRRTVKSYYGGETIRDGVKVGERTDQYRTWGWERSPDGQIVYGSNGFPQYIDHVVNLGTYNPDWEFGAVNNLSYKNFTLGFSFDGRIGGLLYNGVEQKMYEGGMHPATANQFRDDSYAGNATYVGQGVVVTSGSVEYDVQGNIVSDTRKFAPNTKAVKYIDWIFATYVNGVPDANLYKRTFVKLREVTLTYNASPALLKKTPFKGVSISLTGRNLALWSDAPYMDPDGYEGTTLADPSYRNIGFNLNLKF